MNTLRGVITLAQEHRFQLVDNQGVTRLFILAHGAKVQGRDLERLEKSGIAVMVFYTGSDMMNAYNAHDIHEQEQSQAVPDHG